MMNLKAPVIIRPFILLTVILLVGGCSPWHDGSYEIYWVDGQKRLGFHVGDGVYIRRVDAPRAIKTNSDFISVYACPEQQCVFYYIDRAKDHKFADSDEFVFGPFSQTQFAALRQKLPLPEIVLSGEK